MSYIKKPKIKHAGLTKNKLGLNRQDYEGGMSTLCAGCGHDSISSAIVRACFELDIAPNHIAKLSGIGCSSKTPAYFLNQAHGFNSVHGRMPSVTTGANAANGDINYIGVSGDGDSLSIGFGQFAHVIRRNVNMLYIIENNGVYGLTKGQLSASADIGSTNKKGDDNSYEPIDPVVTALSLGCGFVARSFSGDKQQLVPLIKMAMSHRGFALIDVISPCVTFNDNPGSTKSYAHTRENLEYANYIDFVPPRDEISVSYDKGETTCITLHDDSQIQLYKMVDDYDPEDSSKAIDLIQRHKEKGSIVTGLLYVNKHLKDMHARNHTRSTALSKLNVAQLNPGTHALNKLMDEFQ